jgi:hypothetical protein
MEEEKGKSRKGKEFFFLRIAEFSIEKDYLTSFQLFIFSSSIRT